MQARETSNNQSLAFAEGTQDDYPDSYPRENFQYDDLDDDPAPSKGPGHVEVSGTSSERYIAKDFLRLGATFLDRELLERSDDEWYEDAVPIQLGAAVEVSDPRFHVIADLDREGPAAYGHKKRYNPIDGRLILGPVISDREFSEFMQCIDNWVLYLSQEKGHSSETCEAIREKAEWLKKYDEGQWHDVKIVEELSRAVDHSGSTVDYLENNL